MAATSGGEVTTQGEEVTTPTEDLTTATDKKSSKKTLVAGAVILGLLILVTGIGGIVYYVRKNDEPPIVDNDAVLVIDEETAALITEVTWPYCAGQIFANQTAKKLYSIDVRIDDKSSSGPMHVELYDGVVGTTSYIAKSSSKNGQGWTSFDFPTYRILQIPDHIYSFIIVPENKQTISTWYNDNAGLEQGKIIFYNYTTNVHSERSTGSSLTFKLYATQYDDIPIDYNDPVYVIDQETSAVAPDITWPECQGQIFVNQTAKELYSIHIRINDQKNYGLMHVELYNVENSSKIGALIGASYSMTGQGWTSFDFPLHPKLLIPNYTYAFIVVPDDGQSVSIWYNDDAKMGQAVRFLYDYGTGEMLNGPTGSSLTFKLLANQYAPTSSFNPSY